MKKLWYYLFPNYKIVLVKQDECFVDHYIDGRFYYTSTKVRKYYLSYSSRIKRYKLSSKGYRAKESDLYIFLYNKTIQLNDKLNLK